MKLLIAIFTLIAASCVNAPKSVNLTEATTTPTELLQGDFASLDEYEKIAVVGFRVAYAIQSHTGVKVGDAYVVGDGSVLDARASMTVNLTGVDMAKLQAMTDAAYANFMNELKIGGREIIRWETIKNSDGFKSLDTTKLDGKNYVGSLNGRTYVVMTPTSMPLFFKAGEPMVDEILGSSNNISLGTVSYDLKAVSVAPMIVVDFAKTEIGVSTTSQLSVLGGAGHTQLGYIARTTFIKSSVTGGVLNLKPEQILIAENFGQMMDVKTNNNFVDGAKYLFGAGSLSVKSISTRELNIEAAQYDLIVSPALTKVTASFAQAISENK